MFDASAILTEAAASQFGIAVITADMQAAQNLRRRLYAERARLRRTGVTGLDTLSVLIKPVGDTPQREVWVLPRRTKPRPTEPHRSRALARDELPELVRARGPRRPSAFLRNLLHSAIEAPNGMLDEPYIPLRSMRATIAMSKEIGRSIATNKINELRKLSYDALKQLIDEIACDVVNGPDGEYQMETQAFWDSKPGGNIRVMVGIDGPGISSFNSLMEDFIIAPDGSFVGES